MAAATLYKCQECSKDYTWNTIYDEVIESQINTLFYVVVDFLIDLGPGLVILVSKVACPVLLPGVGSSSA